MKQEDYIRNTAGKGNPFKVPEGYFEQFAQRLEDRLPEEPAFAPEVFAAPRRRRLLPLFLAAASVCIALFGATVWFTGMLHRSSQSEARTAAVAHTHTTTSDSYIDAVADYTMMDNSDIYAYLATADEK